MVTETEVWSLRVCIRLERVLTRTSSRGLPRAIAVPDRAFDGAALLISVERGHIDAAPMPYLGFGASIRSRALVGSHATRYTVPPKS